MKNLYIANAKGSIADTNTSWPCATVADLTSTTNPWEVLLDFLGEVEVEQTAGLIGRRNPDGLIELFLVLFKLDADALIKTPA